MELKAGCQKVY